MHTFSHIRHIISHIEKRSISLFGENRISIRIIYEIMLFHKPFSIFAHKVAKKKKLKHVLGYITKKSKQTEPFVLLFPTQSKA